MWHTLPFSCISLYRIKFNFVVSSTEDIAFHINPRIRDNVLVRNSKIDGNWGHEEREVPFNPFMESQYFEVSACLTVSSLY